MVKEAGAASLQDMVDQTPNLVEHFHNDTIAPHYRARTSLMGTLIPPEFTNWRDEQQAWREAAALFDQSHHMPELYVEGPDAFRLLQNIAINSLANFTTDRAKQIVGCTPRGHMIGDCIGYRLGEESFVLVSSMPLQNWVTYQAQIGNYDVKIHRDDPTVYNPSGKRINYRFQLEGPNAAKILNDIVDGGMPEVGFFRVAELTIKGHHVRLLRHGMVGHAGAELSGPYSELEAVRDIILEAGRKYGLLQGGTTTYFSSKYESAWIPYPVPAVFTGEELRGYREWLPANGWEAQVQLGGSFVSPNIEDYYLTPYDIGYGHIIRFDHDFIGRESLLEISKAPPRKKMSLIWNLDDVSKIIMSQFHSGPFYKSIEFPTAYYGWPQFDMVKDMDGNSAGLSMYCGYSRNERLLVSLAVIDEKYAKPGTELVLTWGEPNGGSRKPFVERHEQTTIRATVQPAPYSKTIQQNQRAAINKPSS